MPAGERSQTWFPELVTQLRESWRAGLAWEAVIELRDRLQQRLEGILNSGGIKPATVRCSQCGSVGPGASPVISVRAMLLTLRRFGIEPEDTVRQLDKSWARHRTLYNLDLYGRSVEAKGETVHRHIGEPA